MRALISILVPLALPTVLYFAYAAIVRRRRVGTAENAEPVTVPWAWLGIAGALLAIATVVGFALLEGVGNRGTYHPARVIDGKIQPGYFDDKPR